MMAFHDLGEDAAFLFGNSDPTTYFGLSAVVPPTLSPTLSPESPGESRPRTSMDANRFLHVDGLAGDDANSGTLEAPGVLLLDTWMRIYCMRGKETKRGSQKSE